MCVSSPILTLSSSKRCTVKAQYHSILDTTWVMPAMLEFVAFAGFTRI